MKEALEKHRVLMDLAGHFGFLLVSPEELNDMVKVCAAKRPIRVSEVDWAVELLEKVIEKLSLVSEGKFVNSPLQFMLKDLKAEVALRQKDLPC